MDVNRSGYYKWKQRQGTRNQYERHRDDLTALLLEVHEQHRSYGYHRLAAVVRRETGLIFSDNLAHKCCKYAGIRAHVNHYRWKKPKDESKIFPNLVACKWNAKQPLELVASDMTIMKHKGKQFEWTYLLDTFNNEIISSHIGKRAGDIKPYYDCLEDLIEMTKEQKDPVTLHTDQGSVYSSAAFCNAHKDYNIIRSMSRVATPTDNCVIEAINGWVKAEMYAEGWHRMFDSPEEMIDTFVYYYNHYRPAYSLQYKTPVQYRTDLGYL